MQGPMAAPMLPSRAPSRTIAATVSSTTPDLAPRQPACAAPITPACGSASSTGAQSAVRMPRATPRMRVTMPSTRGRAAAGQGASTTATRAVCA